MVLMPTRNASSARAASATRVPPEPQWLRAEATIALRLLILAAAFVVAIWMVLQIQLVAVAAFIAFAHVALLWPVVRVLRRALPRVVASLLAVTAYLAAFGGLVFFVARRVVNTGPDLLNAVIGGIESVSEVAVRRGWQVPQDVVNNLTDQLRDIVASIASFALTGLSAAGNLITVLVIATFATIFALTSGDDLWRSALRLFPTRRRAAADAALRQGFATARWWLLASTVTGLVNGSLIGAGLWLLGVPLAVAIGAATFVLGYIPMIGATLAGVVAVIVALFVGGVQTALWALLLVLAVQQIEGNVLSPLLLSRAVQFHPVVTLLLSTSGGLAFGILGLFLAVPVPGILPAVTTTWRRVGVSAAAPFDEGGDQTGQDFGDDPTAGADGSDGPGPVGATRGHGGAADKP